MRDLLLAGAALRLAVALLLSAALWSGLWLVVR
jgi:hypothetical protein